MCVCGPRSSLLWPGCSPALLGEEAQSCDQVLRGAQLQKVYVNVACRVTGRYGLSFPPCLHPCGYKGATGNPDGVRVEGGLSGSVKAEISWSQRQVTSKYWESRGGVTQVSGNLRNSCEDLAVRPWAPAPGARLWGPISSAHTCQAPAVQAHRKAPRQATLPTA